MKHNNAYTAAIQQYLAFLGAACIIASLFIGPGAILVWVVTAILLTWSDKYRNSRSPPASSQKCKRKKRR